MNINDENEDLSDGGFGEFGTGLRERGSYLKKIRNFCTKSL
jgi:hypothetical protein